MSGPITIRDGEAFPKDPLDVRVLLFDFDDHLNASASISGVPTFTITTIHPTSEIGAPTLTKDLEHQNQGTRDTNVRISGGTLGARYKLECTIVTSETPAQTFNKKCFVDIDDL